MPPARAYAVAHAHCLMRAIHYHMPLRLPTLRHFVVATYTIILPHAHFRPPTAN